MSAERRTLGLVLGGLALIAMTALVSGFFSNFERRVEHIPKGYSAEARRNPLLAAERFLDKLGIPVESVAGRALLWDLPAPNDTLVVLGLGPMSEARRSRLMVWLEQGGHLVVEAMEIWSEERPPDDFLTGLGFRLRIVPDVSASTTKANDEEHEVQASVRLPAETRPLKVDFQPGYALEGRADDALLAVADDWPRVIRRPIGRGRLTVLSDSRFLLNRSIGDQDHAYFMARLVEPREGGKVWLLFDSAMPWLGALVWRAAPYATLSAGLLVLIWLWSLGRRLGPLTGPPDRRRRDLIEHLDASGDFLWRHGRAAQLVESSRRRVLSEWLKRRPDVGHAPRHEQAEALARLTGEPADRISRALFTQPDDARAFVEQAALMQQLRENARGGAFEARPSRPARPAKATS